MQKFTGKEYIMIDIANSYGLDRKDWDERLDWVRDHEDHLEEMISSAEEPAQFFAGVQAYRKAQHGISSGYPVSLDATASGIQILSCLIGCATSAAHVNLTPGLGRQDAYTNNNDEINKLLGTSNAIERKDSKRALMTSMYMSKKVPKEVFGEDTPELDAFYQASDNLFPGVVRLNQALLGLWQPTALVHRWVLPDGFVARVKVMDEIEHQVQFRGHTYTIKEEINRPMEEGISLPANIIHSIDAMVVREMNHRCNYDKTHVQGLRLMVTGGLSQSRKKDQQLIRLLDLADKHEFFSAVIIEYLDEKNFGLLTTDQAQKLQNLLATMEKSFEIMANHDCFRFLPNNGNHVRQHYINILAEISDSNMLTYIAADITGNFRQARTQSISHLIRQSEYALS